MGRLANPIRITVSELRAKLAHYLREAKNGARFLILSRGVPMAELGPPSDAAGK